MSLVNLFCSAIIITFFYLFIASKLFDKKINFKNKKVILSIIFLIIILPIITIFFDNFIRAILTFTATVIACYFVFGDSFYKTVLVAVTIFLYYFIAELVFGAVLTFVFQLNSAEAIKAWKGQIYTDAIVSALALAVSYIRLGKKVFLKMANNNETKPILEIILAIVFGIGILGTTNGKSTGWNSAYITNIILVFIFILIIYYLFKEKAYNNQLSEKYDQLFKYMEKYETELTQKSICIHEFKNQIISIKGFTNEKNNELNNYLDSIVSDLNNTQSIVLKDMENLPKGGLKGLIYYKLAYLNAEGVEVLLHINANTKKSPFTKLNSNDYKDILKLIGVYLDNAVEAAKASSKKQLILEMYYEKKILNIILSNTYSGNINVEMFDRKGYSTKGKGRGYGLLLANSIVNKYENITQSREITTDYYTQKISIDFKSISN
jgi:two-component system sensor histidine kinase AgrC